MSEETPQRMRPAAGHRIPDDQWAKIEADAAEFAAEDKPEPEQVEQPDDGGGPGRPRAAGPRAVAAIPPVINWTAQGVASGKYFPVSGIPTQLIVFHSMECPLANGYAQSVTKWALPSLAAGGPEASWHRSYGPDARVYFVPDELGAWHASEANPLSIGLEQTGYAAYTRAQWTTPAGLTMLEGVAYDVAQICKRDGIPARWLSTAEVRAVLDGGNRSIKGFCFHRQVDPETRTDPGDGYPSDITLNLVKKYLGGATPAPTNGGLTVADINSLTKQLNAVLAAVAPISTSAGEVGLRQFIADGTRAAQAAEANTGPINTSAGQEPLRVFVAKGTRAAEKAAATIGALQATVTALAAENSTLTAADVEKAAKDGAAKALAELQAAADAAGKAAGPRAAAAGEDQDTDINGPTYQRYAAAAEQEDGDASEG